MTHSKSSVRTYSKGFVVFLYEIPLKYFPAVVEKFSCTNQMKLVAFMLLLVKVKADGFKWCCRGRGFAFIFKIFLDIKGKQNLLQKLLNLRCNTKRFLTATPTLYQRFIHAGSIQ